MLSLRSTSSVNTNAHTCSNCIHPHHIILPLSPSLFLSLFLSLSLSLFLSPSPSATSPLYLLRCAMEHNTLSQKSLKWVIFSHPYFSSSPSFLSLSLLLFFFLLSLSHSFILSLFTPTSRHDLQSHRTKNSRNYFSLLLQMP